ncbi:MAG TPA: carboxypeptidase-like regulatory domain-containing protein, partial [Kofleriaceae bacterium]
MRRSALLLLCVLAHGAAAQPHQVQIRAQTRLTLDRVRLIGDDQAEVRGQLVDGLTGDALQGQMIEIQIGDEKTQATTGPDGRFRATIHKPDSGPQAIDLSFRGTKLMEPAQINQLADPARAQVILTIDVADAPGALQVVVRATADDRPVDLPIALSVGPNERALAPLASITSGAPFLLTRKAAGGPGAHRLRAEFAGDETRQAAKVERTVELTSASITTIALSASRIAYEDDLVVTGRVTDEDGPGIHRAAVSLTSGDRRLAQGATAEDGSYRFRVEGEVLGQGQWGLQVSADPGRPAIRPSRSSPEIVRVSNPAPVPVSY